ncbi:MAG: hypothetical protein R3251_03455 [Candidatus Spechtbacterales bacterium]|nr:hypothetical protein [Candidatus Spechtbacterales bacterium]
MTPITILFVFAFASLLFSLLYLQRKVSIRQKELSAKAFFAKIEQETRMHLRRLYGSTAVLAVLVSGVLYAVPVFSFEESFSFLAGVLVMMAIVHSCFTFLSKFYSKFAGSTSYGFIGSFNSLFGTGNVLGVFIISSVLFFTTAHYTLIGPSTPAIVSFVLGGLFFGMIFKTINPDIKSSLFLALEKVLEFGELAFSAVIISMIVSSLLLPGFIGAAVLPLLSVGAGIIASLLGVGLMQMGATTNIFKNITVSMLGAILLFSIIIFPLIVWAMNENVQYSNIKLWISSFGAVALVGAMTLLQYFRKKYLSRPIVLLAFIPAGIYLSYLLADLYGFSIFIVSLISVSPVIFSMFIFTHITQNFEFALETIDMPAEQKKIIYKLNSISESIIRGSKAYIWLVGTFIFIGFFLLYQNELDSQLIRDSFSLENPHVITGVFLALIAIFVAMRYIFSISPTNKESKPWAALDVELLRRSFIALGGFFLAPAILSIFGGAEMYSGFFIGIVVIATTLTVPGSLFDIKRKSNYSAITERAEILSRLRILGPASLLLIVFLI